MPSGTERDHGRAGELLGGADGACVPGVLQGAPAGAGSWQAALRRPSRRAALCRGKRQLWPRIAYMLLPSSHRCYSLRMALTVDWDQDALAELRGLPVAERGAVMNAVAKLEVFGDQLGSPHTSQVKGSRSGIRELRPRAGRSPWRVLYRRVADAMVVLAVGPEAEHDQRGFDRAVRRAEERLKEIKG